MSRIVIVPIAILLLCVPFMQARAAEPVELKHAFQAGDVALNMTALEQGKRVEVTIENLSGADMSVVIEKGKTMIDLYDFKVYLVAAESQKLEITKGASATVTLPMEQEGGGSWTGGSVKISKVKTDK